MDNNASKSDEARVNEITEEIRGHVREISVGEIQKLYPSATQEILAPLVETFIDVVLYASGDEKQDMDLVAQLVESLSELQIKLGLKGTDEQQNALAMMEKTKALKEITLSVMAEMNSFFKEKGFEYMASFLASHEPDSTLVEVGGGFLNPETGEWETFSFTNPDLADDRKLH